MRQRLMAIGLVLLVVSVSSAEQGMRVRRGGGVALRLIEMSDLTWQGYYRIASNATGGSAAGFGALAVRYTNSTPGAGTCADTRRLLIPHLQLSGSYRTWGDLVEYCVPSSSSYYTGASPASATALLEVRRWAAAEWADKFTTVGDSASGNYIGGLWWDETNGVLWVNVYGYYYGNNMPSHMAVDLGDGAHGSLGGNYKAVDATYGPWYYRSTTAGSETLHWKQVNHGFLPVPASAQSDLGGRTMALAGSVGAVATVGHLGLGLRAINLPSLGTAANAVFSASDNSGLGLRLADYTMEFGGARPWAHRDTNYTFKPYTDHLSSDTGLYPPGDCGSAEPTGCWQMSMDQTNGVVWVETAAVHGVLSFGRQVQGGTGYGHNPISRTPRSMSATRTGTTANVTMNTHNLATGASVTVNCVQPAQYAGTFTITVTGTHTFTYTMASDPGASASHLSSGTTTYGQSCASIGAIVGFGWSASVQADHTDQGRANPETGNGYSGEVYTGAVRRLNPLHLRAVALGTYSPQNTATNWTLIGDWYTQSGWDIPPYSTLEAGATNTRINQLSVNTHGMFWDATAKQIIWVQASSASDALTTSSLPPTVQFFSVP